MQGKKSDSILISDLSAAKPATAVSTFPEEGQWLSTDYELDDGSKGVMLSAEPFWNAPQLEIPIEKCGTYRIFIGVNYAFQHYTTNSYGSLWLKLSGDPGFSRIGMERYDLHAEGKYRTKILPEKATKESYNTIYEVYWRTEEVTGKSLFIRPPKPPFNNEPYCEQTNIAFIKLEPVTGKDLEVKEALQRNEASSNMAAIWCAGALSGHTKGHFVYHPTDTQWFIDELEAYRDSDFGILCIEAIRGNYCLFNTKHGDFGSRDRVWDESWVDPLGEFAKVGHEMGKKVFAAMRMIGGGRPMMFYPINWARFYWDKQQWAKKDRDGNLCSNLSLAYPEVRRHWLNLLRETLDRGTDGIHLHFNRCAPYVMYEEPSVRAFMEKYGEDPRSLPEEDERWQRHVAGYVTQFVREIRELLDEKPGRELSIIFAAGSDFNPGSVRNGSDPEAWIEEELVDYLFADHSTNRDYIEHWKRLSDGKVKVYYSLMPRTQPGEEFAMLAKGLYEDGADGFCVWDCERRVQRASEWNVLKNLGHRGLLGYYAENAEDYYRFNRIKYMRGLNVLYSYKDG